LEKKTSGFQSLGKLRSKKRKFQSYFFPQGSFSEDSGNTAAPLLNIFKLLLSGLGRHRVVYLPGELRASLKTALFPIYCVVQDFPQSSSLARARDCGPYKIFPPCLWKKYYVFRDAPG
jgi:hypothetical protein